MDEKEITILGTAYNEVDNIEQFCLWAIVAGRRTNKKFEVIIIDDGSSDGTSEKLSKLEQMHPELKTISFRRNFGQTAGLDAGFSRASGKLIYVFDTDLQQDPRELIPILSQKIDEGYEVVSGYRLKRKHTLLIKVMASFGYLLRKTLLDVPIRDTACSPNVFKKSVLSELDLYGEMHRFLVPVLYWRGVKVTEVNVPHHSRGSGRSKYSAFKALRAFLDLLTTKFWMGYSVRPMHFFGTAGIIIGGAGFLVGTYVFTMRMLDPNALVRSTLPLFSVLLMITGIQFTLFGILADIMTRIYFRDRKTYYEQNDQKK